MLRLIISQSFNNGLGCAKRINGGYKSCLMEEHLSKLLQYIP